MLDTPMNVGQGLLVNVQLAAIIALLCLILIALRRR